MTEKEKWVSCDAPEVSDTIRWKEPIWAVPSKARGKPDKAGEQSVTAELVTIGEPCELRVIKITQLSLIEGVPPAPAKIKTGDMIRRKASSIIMGDCQKLEEN